jgi:hypothetical protein
MSDEGEIMIDNPSYGPWLAARGVPASAEWCDREGGCFCKFRNVVCSNYVGTPGVPACDSNGTVQCQELPPSHRCAACPNGVDTSDGGQKK